MKGLVLSGGAGTRLRPLTYSQQKQLIPVGNKPILFYAIEDLIEAGVDEIFIIVGQNRESVMEVVKGAKWTVPIDFIHQESPLGIAHAVKIAGEHIGENEFITYLGDNILRDGITRYAKEFMEGGCDGSILLTPVKNPSQFGVAELDGGDRVIKLVEKPKEPPSNLALVGIYFFKPIIFKAINSIKPSWRGELEITDAVQWLIDEGYTVNSSRVSGWWKDTGKTEDILDANRLILDELETDVKGDVDEIASIKGRVQIGRNSRVEGKSLIKGPVIIGENCTIKDAYIGPFTSIGNGVRIEGTEIEDSVILQDCEIVNTGRIVDSLIGRGVKIHKNNTLPKGHKFVIGDNSEVTL